MTTNDSEIDDLVAKMQEVSKTVYSVLGPGHEKSVYRLAMSVELRDAKVPRSSRSSL